MFKSAVIASVCAIGISAVNLDIEAELSASVDSHKKRRYFNPGPRLIVVDQGPNYPPPPPPRPRTPTPRVIRRVQRPVCQSLPDQPPSTTVDTTVATAMAAPSTVATAMAATAMVAMDMAPPSTAEATAMAKDTVAMATTEHEARSRTTFDQLICRWQT